MKKMFTVLLVMSLTLTCACAASAQVNSDRSKKGDGEAAEWRFDFNVPFYSRLKAGKAELETRMTPGNFGVAFIRTDNDAFDSHHSVEIFCTPFVRTYRNRRHLISYGIGVNARNLVTVEEMMTKSADGGFGIGDWPESARRRTSTLDVGGVTFPVLYGYDIFDGVGVTVGTVLNLNVYASLTNEYRIDGERQKVRYGKVRCNPVTVDLMMQLNSQYYGVYVRYSPMNLMNTKYWPGVRNYWAIGLTLCM